MARQMAPGHFALETVSVLGAHRISVEELVHTSGVAAGTSVLSLDHAEISRRLASHPWISEARVISLLPRKLLMAVVERETAAVAEIGTTANAWLVDENGAPFAPATAIDREVHPTIVGIPDAQPGHPHPLLAQGVYIARAVGERGLPPARRVRVGGADLRTIPELRLGSGERTVVLGGGDLEAKLDRLSWVLEADLAEAGETSTIDLRFGGQVILRSGPPLSGDEATGARGGVDPSNGGRAG
jgi:hypothetical protein